jgi:ankyrin repeat protein
MALRSIGLAAVLAMVVSAETPTELDRFYQAIRQDDLVTLRALVRDEGVNATDAQGETPLMLSAAFGSAEAVRLLIDSGAAVTAASNAGVTALHLGASNLAKARMLIEAGADVNAVSKLGRTPLIVAASANETADAIRLMLAKGANVNAADAVGVTALIAAAIADNTETALMLLAKGADAHAAARTGESSTALMGAALNGNVELVRALLARRPDLTIVSADRTATVKNGPVRYGGVTALHTAVTGGNHEVVELLLRAGTPVDAVDVRGMTPLMWAVATDRPEPRIVRLLLAHGAKRDLQSRAGESTVDWARKFNHPRVLTEHALPRLPEAVAPEARAPRPGADSPSARLAVGRSLPLLRAASARTSTDGGCAACHAQPLTALAIDKARARGWTALSSEPESARSPVLLNLLTPQLRQLRAGGSAPDNLVYATWLLASQRTPPNRVTDTVVHYLAAKQRRDGNWRSVGATRAPMQDGDFSRTALSIRALTAYGTPARAGEYRRHVDRAAAWLSAQTPLSTEDRVMQLLGIHWAAADARVRDARIRELLALQREDGGWAQTPYLASDAYATGQVLDTLRELGVRSADAARQRGAAFLVRTQREDGSWHVKSRAMKIQPYFESGFPYGHDQWISQAATAWATMGLVAAPLTPVTEGVVVSGSSGSAVKPSGASK